LAIRSWISKELTILAEGFGEQLTLERVEIYVTSLVDIPQERLRVAFRRAMYELKWFPKLAELRDLSGSSADDEKKVEAQAAWDFANKYLREWGVDRMPVRSNGRWITAPTLEPRLEYAIRQIGGLWRLNQISDESYPFVFRDFCEAYAVAPTAELLDSLLLEKFGLLQLAGQIKELPLARLQHHSANAERPTPEETEEVDQAKTRQDNQKISQLRTGEPSGSQLEELTPKRKEELRQKLARELAARGIPRGAEGLE